MTRLALEAHNRPILLTGMPRSGTTWVGRMLAISGEVGYIEEPFNLSPSPGSVRVPTTHWFEYLTVETEAQLQPALARVLRLDYPLARELRRCRTRDDFYNTFNTWRRFTRSRGKRALVKEPHAVFSARWFVERLGSDVIVIVREPLAVVSSWKRLGWSFDFANLLDQPALMRDWLAPFEAEMNAALDSSSQLIERVALLWRIIYSVVRDERFPPVHLLRHEDLSRAPTEAFARLYGALSLTYQRKIAETVEASSSPANPPETLVGNPHETRLDSRANLDNWRHRLNQDEIERIRELTEATAVEYYPDLSWS